MAYCLSFALIACAALAAAGCGESSAEPKGPGATLRITRDFGQEVVAEHDLVPLEGRKTLLRQLRAEHEVKTIFDDAQVVEIDGLRSRREVLDGKESTWVTNVNGIETDVYPSDYKLYDGDVVQWDLRDWYVTLDVRATVGAFPQTFTRGVFGGRFPVTVVCEERTSEPCGRVKRVLRRAGVPINGSLPPASPVPPPLNPQRARVLVGRWEHLRGGRWARLIDAGPRYSGVFARFSPAGDALRLLDWNAHPQREEGRGTGLVAAMRPTEEDLVWVVTGVDDAGLERAARALDPDTLRDAFAVAVTADGAEKLPLEPR